MILAIQISFHFDVVVRSSCFIENALGEEVFIEATFLDGAAPNALRDEMWLKSTFEAIYLLGYFHWYIRLTCSDFLCFIYLIQLRLTFITIQLIFFFYFPGETDLTKFIIIKIHFEFSQLLIRHWSISCASWRCNTL